MLVDDHPVMRVGLANVLSLNHGFRIVAQAVARGFELGLLKIGAGAWSCCPSDQPWSRAKASANVGSSGSIPSACFA
jgi:hypothetical protein